MPSPPLPDDAPREAAAYNLAPDGSKTMYIGIMSFAITSAFIAVHGWLTGAIGDAYVAGILALCAAVNGVALIRPRSRSRARCV